MRELGSEHANSAVLFGEVDPQTGEIDNDTGSRYNFLSRAFKDGKFCYEDIDRADKILVQVVEELGEEASEGRWLCKLVVVEIPDGVDWVIEDYDGYEHIAEKHRTWGRDKDE